MQENRIRIVDIAERLGLSTATVSNVIHGKTSKMSPRTAQRVWQELEAVGYIPDMAGVWLAQKSSRVAERTLPRGKRKGLLLDG